MNSVLTKDFLSNKEKETFAEHNILFLNRKMEELTSVVRDFGRYVVETLRPKTNFFASKWGLAILIIALIILAIMFGPSILNAVAAASKGTGTAIGGAVSGTQIITK